MMRSRTCLAALAAAALTTCTLVAHAGATTVDGIVTVDGEPVPHAIVYLEAPEGAEPPATTTPARAVMDQRNLTFRPYALPVMRGTVVEFTNSDDVEHNVFSPSVIAGKFNLGTYAPGAARDVALNQAGDVRVLCNIHMEMEAHILVLDTPYFATAAENGHYVISDVPAGSYTVKVWYERWLPFRKAVDIANDGTVTLGIGATR